MYCTNCGNKIIEGDRFCSKCGCMVQGYTQEERPKTINRSYRKISIAAIAIALVIILIAVGRFKAGKTNDVPENNSISISTEVKDSFTSDFLPGQENTTNAFGGCISSYKSVYNSIKMVNQGDWIYYCTPYRSMYKVNVNDSNNQRIELISEEKIKHDTNGQYRGDYIMQCYDFCVIGDWLYWGGYDGSIWKMRTDGKQLTPIVENRLPNNASLYATYEQFYGGRHFIVSDGWIYYTVLEGIQKDTTNYEFMSYLARTKDDGSITEALTNKYNAIDIYDKESEYMVVPGGTSKSVTRNSTLSWPFELMGLCPDDQSLYVNASYYHNSNLTPRILTYDSISGEAERIKEIPEYIAQNTEWWEYNGNGWDRSTNKNGIIPGMIVFTSAQPGCTNYYCWKFENVGHRFSEYNVSDPIFEAALDGNTYYINVDGIRCNDKLVNADSKASALCYVPNGQLYYAIDHSLVKYGIYRTNIDGTDWEDVSWMIE